LSPTKAAAPLTQPPLASMRGCSGRGHEGRLLRGQLRRQLAQRRDVIDDPDAAAVGGEHEVVVAWLDREITHRD